MHTIFSYVGKAELFGYRQALQIYAEWISVCAINVDNEVKKCITQSSEIGTYSKVQFKYRSDHK